MPAVRPARVLKRIPSRVVQTARPGNRCAGQRCARRPVRAGREIRRSDCACRRGRSGLRPGRCRTAPGRGAASRWEVVRCRPRRSPGGPPDCTRRGSPYRGWNPGEPGERGPRSGRIDIEAERVDLHPEDRPLPDSRSREPVPGRPARWREQHREGRTAAGLPDHVRRGLLAGGWRRPGGQHDDQKQRRRMEEPLHRHLPAATSTT